MKTIKISFLAFIAIMATALAIPALAGDKTLGKPGVLNDEEILLSEKLSAQYDTFIVKDFPTDGAELENINADEKKELAEYRPSIVKNFTESVVKSVKKRTGFKTVMSNSGAKGKAVILEGKFVKFNAGQGAAKIWLGMFAPSSAKTNITIEGKLKDAKTGKVLATFKNTRSGSEGGNIGFMGKIFEIQAKDAGDEVAEFIEKLY
jgi:hypothetical protein